MQTRRGFLKRIAAAVAVAVAAPVILREALSREMPTVAYWVQTSRASRCVDAEYEALFQKLLKECPQLYSAIRDMPCARKGE